MFRHHKRKQTEYRKLIFGNALTKIADAVILNRIIQQALQRGVLQYEREVLESPLKFFFD